jgi:hypothetical protein
VPVAVRLEPPNHSQRPRREAEVVAAGIGLQSLHFDPVADVGSTLTLSQREELPPTRQTVARVAALVPAGRSQAPALYATEIELPFDGKDVELQWNGTGWKAK